MCFGDVTTSLRAYIADTDQEEGQGRQDSEETSETALVCVIGILDYTS